MKQSRLTYHTLLLLQLLILSRLVNAGEFPPCALACASAIPGATDPPNRVCIDAALQAEIGTCVQRSCTIKEGLTAQNATATICDYPHRDRSSLCKTVSFSLLTVASVAVVARLLSRTPKYGEHLGIDDYVISVIWLILICFTALIYEVSAAGLGRDIWAVTFDDITLILKYFTILTYLYILLTWLTKISILFLYLRLFPDETFRKVVKILIAICCICGSSICLACILRCSPVSLAWTFWDGEHKGRCTQILLSAQGWPSVAINITADLIVLFLPLPTIWKLNLALGKKFSVMIMLSTGIFVTVISIFRPTTFPRLVASKNFTWDWTDAGLWSAIEIYVGVICACMPGVRAFFTKIFPRSREMSLRTKTTRGDTSDSEPSSVGTISSGYGRINMMRRDTDFDFIIANGGGIGPLDLRDVKFKDTTTSGKTSHTLQ